ncbi:CopG family transcriptional regulator (plasmid) [Simplicispira suum]|uniref:Relaxosome protein TraY n=2 Tax=Simplicispira suum TaxID=2109915 RepID=A0A2S0N619_9BURK|nr:CopG family transcriptional regulator [Simplicispira suum]
MSVSLRLPEDLDKRLGDLAVKTGRSKTFYMLEAIREHLDDLENLYLAEQRLIDSRAGRTRAISLDEVIHRLGENEAFLGSPASRDS